MYVCDDKMTYRMPFYIIDDNLFLSLFQEYIEITSNHQDIPTIEKFNNFYANKWWIAVKLKHP